MIPDSISLNGCEIKIRMVDHLYRDHACYGMYSAMNMIIELDSSMSDQKKEVILCHEIVEVIKDQYLLGLKEHEIQTIAIAFHDIIKNNKVNFNS